MPYKFSLAAVLRLRESVEERERRTLEKIQHEIVQTMHLIDRLEEQVQETAKTREQAMRQTLPAFQLQALEDIRRTLVKRKEEATEFLVSLHKNREEQLLVFEAARRDREVLSEMRDRQAEAYRTAETRQQQKAIDDLFGARHKRK